MTDRLDDTIERAREAAQLEGDDLDNLVTTALESLKARRVPTCSPLSRRFVDLLRDHVISDKPSQVSGLINEMRKAQIPVHEIIDYYVPEVARELGLDWENNRRSFSEVSIGSARLQALLREMTRDEAIDPIADANAPAIAVVILGDEFHTLGGMVLSHQLRRCGASVHLMMGESHDSIADSIQRDQFDAVFVSVSRVEKLVSAKKLVDKLRHTNSSRIPVVVGGPVLGNDSDIKSLTGADYVANSAEDGLLKCGLRTSVPAAGLRVVWG